VLSLNVVALENTNAFVEVADYYGDLQDIPASYLVGGGEFLVGEIGGEVVAMGGLQLRTYEIAELKRMRVLPDGADSIALWKHWMAAEDRHFATEHTREHADFVVSGVRSD
jgi:hypothetical protein